MSQVQWYVEASPVPSLHTLTVVAKMKVRHAPDTNVDSNPAKKRRLSEGLSFGSVAMAGAKLAEGLKTITAMIKDQPKAKDVCFYHTGQIVSKVGQAETRVQDILIEFSAMVVLRSACLSSRLRG